MIDAAFLVYAPLKERRKDNSFDGNDNIGAKVIADVLRRAGIEVGYCSPESAHEHRLVLVSLTSTHDVYAYYQAVSLLPSWQPGKRTFKVLAGGFGMQNPTTIRNYVDFAAFGRAHDWIVPVVDAILGGGVVPEHPSLMFLPDIQPVLIHQSPLYNAVIDGGTTPYGEQFSEQFTGCPLKCKFCHYTYARTYADQRETKGSYVQESLTGGGTPELTWDGLFTYGKKLGRVRVAIDGFSERLRYIYGKRIANDDIIAGLETIGSYEGNTVALVYNIANFPAETDDDREDLYKTLRMVNPDNRVVFVLHSTPFRPSLATPMQWEPVSLAPDWSKLRSQVIVERDTFRAVHSFTLETPFTHLTSVIAERATPETDKLFHVIAHAPALRTGTSAQKLRKVESAFDVTPYTRAYDPMEPHPVWFLSGSIPTQQLTRIAVKMRSQIERTKTEAGWLPGGGSMVKQRLAAHGGRSTLP